MAGTAGLLQTIIRTNNSLNIGLFANISPLFASQRSSVSRCCVCQVVMPRCRECRPCIEVVEARAKYKGGNKALQKKLKRIEWKNKCQDTQKTTKKQRINEADNLRSAGYGGEIKEETKLPFCWIKVQMNPADRADRPANLAKAPCLDKAK